MTGHSKIAIWAKQTRANFLFLSILLVLIGAAAAHLDGTTQVLRALLAAVGVVLAHVSVNLFNEYSDYLTGIDANTKKTPFSGGSGTLQQGLNKPGTVKKAAIGSLFIAFLIGLYLAAVSTWYLLIPMVLGGVASVFYTSHLAKWALGELAAGLCLGTLVVIGTYIAITGTLTWPVVVLSVPPGILTAELLFLNEFPDMEADMQGGRKHLVIRLGKARASILYSAALALTYAVIGTALILHMLPAWCGLAFLTLPLAAKAGFTAVKHHDNFEKMIPAQGANVITVLATDLLLAIGLFLA
ncbi:MAG: prenyltransferase [Deltaproteobacteria bacterium]|nr:prenyltransferase [Deltaproteobacteria bacterium]